MKRPKLRISEAALRILLNYTYPGNIRELENIIEGLYVFCRDTVQPTDLPKRLISLPTQVTFPTSVNEKLRIEEMLVQTGGNQSKSAKNLGISINTFKARLRKYNLNREDYKRK